MNGHEAVLDDLALLALDALGEQEAAAARAHLAQCDACAAEYRRMRAVADVLPLAADPESPPSATLKARIMATTQPAPAPLRAVRRNPYPYFAAAACLALAVLFGVLYGVQNGRVQRQNAIIADLVSPASQRYPVRTGEVVRHGGRVYIAMRDVPAPPRGKVYQAWTLPKGSKRMRPSVTFLPSGGQVLLQLPVDARNVGAVAVSVEPSGGSTQPTSTPVFVVKFTS